MLSPVLLKILNEANTGVGRYEGTPLPTQTCKIFATVTRNLYKARFLRMREIRIYRDTLHLCTPYTKTANAIRLGHHALPLQRIWTFDPTRRASSRTYY